LRLWGRQAEAPAIPWPDVEARLAATEEYWLVSVQADGPPTPRPVWGVWLDERLLLSVGSPSHWRAIDARPEVAVHLGDPLAVVIIEGTARRAAGSDVLHPYVDAYNAKYSWGFDAAEPMVVDGTIEVVPSTVLAWSTIPASECSPDMKFPSAAGRWTFG
jgi:hypothetical protein